MKCPAVLSALLFLFFLLCQCYAFQPLSQLLQVVRRRQHQPCSSPSMVILSAVPPDRETIMARNNARTCVKSFLTQRAIQSFLFLLEECRDPHSGKWIQEFLGLKNILEYHGTGAFDIDRFPYWEMVLLEMMEQPKGKKKKKKKKKFCCHISSK